MGLDGTPALSRTYECDDRLKYACVGFIHHPIVGPGFIWNLYPAEQKPKQDEEKVELDHFKETVSRDIDGRYSVRLAWKGGVQKIPSDYKIAEQRLNSTTEKLRKAGEVTRYDGIFKAWLEEGITARVPTEIKEDCYFLPYRPVFKPQSITTSVRIVFDASCKVGRNPSLNDCLHKGVNYIELIPSVMMRFREGRIGVLSDIMKAFQMINVGKDDRRFLQLLWWSDDTCTEICVYQHQCSVWTLGL